MQRNQRRVAVFSAVFVLFPMVLFSQVDSGVVQASNGQSLPPGQQSVSMQDSGPNSGDVGQLVKDKMFLRGATEAGIAHVKFSQLALEKSSSDDVKSFAQTMVDDHTKLNQDLARVADSMGITLPKRMNKEDEAQYAKLQSLSGNDFDTAYLTLMVKEHHRSMRVFRMEANTVNDPSLRDAVGDGEHVIHGHLVMVNKLAREKGIPMPEHKHAPPPPAPQP